MKKISRIGTSRKDNAYDGKKPTIEALVEKLMGKSPFKGVSPVDAYCGLFDTRI